MDQVGPQKKIKSDQYHESFEKLIGDGGAKSSYGGNLPSKSATKKAKYAYDYDDYKGKVSGDTKHTYGSSNGD